jgi:diguanylate cyclase (GGDEF)-like protein
MKQTETKNELNASGRNYLYLTLISLGLLAVTFLLSNSNLTFQTKSAAFVLMIFIYLLICAILYVRKKKYLSSQPDKDNSDSIFNESVEGKLLALEEANQFFGATLKPADMFRLVASRINEITPFAACALWLVDDAKKNLTIVYATGDNLKKNIGTEIESEKGLAGKVFQSRKSSVDPTLELDHAAFSAESLGNLNSAIAVPLVRNEAVFGVLTLYGEKRNEFDHHSMKLLEAIGERCAPLFLSSQAVENSLNNALTDTLTNLPNERAFFLILENQIAETQRFREERPLTILAIDIKDFGEHNQRFGHIAGDRLLLFAADKIKNQLRQMDFLARITGDEFLAVLPTASESITRDIVGRIEKTFIINPFEISEQEKIHLQLNFGAASFGKHGETASQLLKHAVIRKKQSKSAQTDGKILWFPKEYIN